MTLLVAGYLTVDVAAHVPAVPGFDERVTAARVERGAGGMAANAAAAAARLGTAVRFFGQAGTGALGDESVEALERAGVDAAGVARVPDGDTFCLIFIGPDGARSIVSEPLTFDWDRADAALAAGDATGLHVDGYRLADGTPRAAVARERGVCTSIDADGAEEPSWETLTAVAPAYSVLFLNRGIAECAGQAPRETAEGLVAAGAGAACVTLGADGVVVADASGVEQIGGIEVDAQDTTGAGDVFAGAFLHRFLDGAPAREAARFANGAAALSTTGLGARGLQPSREDVFGLLAAQPPIEEAVR